MRAKAEDLTRDIGVSNYSEEQIMTLAEATGEAPVVNQIEWSPFGWSQSMLEFCQANGIIIQAYSPLTRATRLDDGVLQMIAEKRQKTPAQVLIRWCLQIGTVPLPKANRLRHLEENLQVFDFELDKDDMAELSALNENYSTLSDKPIYQL
jgi:2,5-diketo-D-gluconate reductase A